jgi:sodium-dependent dicarboxylate transporter 2/3/5
MPEPPVEASPTLQRIGLVLGPLLAAVVLLAPAPEGLSREAWIVVALAALMGVWWMTEAVPMAATALLPIVVLPLTGISTVREATQPFAEPIIFLLLGGMIIALALERWGLHRRIALAVLTTVGTSPRRLVLGFILATAFLSMWISNSAATMMMLPIALSVAGVIGQRAFTSAVLLGVAYAASIGGMATVIGTPPNAMAAGYIRQTFGTEVAFLEWMRVGVPIMLVMLPAIWLVVTRLTLKVSNDGATGGLVVAEERYRLGRITTPEQRVAWLCLGAALCWVGRPILQDLPGLGRLSDEVTAIAFAILMFLVPAGATTEPRARLLSWTDCGKLNWGVILLFGGGLSLAAAIDKTGLAQWLGTALAGVTDLHPFLLGLLLAAGVCFLSEIASNTALVAALLPVLGATAQATGMDPLLLILPATLAASCGFMLPAATGPNAIAYGSGRLPARDMLRAGFVLDWIGIVTIATITWLLLG